MIRQQQRILLMIAQQALRCAASSLDAALDDTSDESLFVRECVKDCELTTDLLRAVIGECRVVKCVVRTE
jgi:hypothetical protein